MLPLHLEEGEPVLEGGMVGPRAGEDAQLPLGRRDKVMGVGSLN